MAIERDKKGDRITGLTRIRLVEIDGATVRLTLIGQVLAIILSFISWMVREGREES
jgi:4-hydroxybenzoate polyprenyltransferase